MNVLFRTDNTNICTSYNNMTRCANYYRKG
jgi:hypothetical protein